ncbi:hypothetical protein PHAVU_001G104900 [Phaseolus vulgaris]
MDCAFAIEFENELGEEWILSNYQGNIHIVYYNKDILCPQIFYGWSSLRDFYGFKGHQSILFRYMGNNTFHIIIYMGELCESVDLPSPFAEYVRRGKFKKVTLHGSLQDVEYNIFKSRFPSRSITLGSGWKHFCRLHSIREDDKIIFECHNKKPSSNIRVLLLMTSHYKRLSV